MEPISLPLWVFDVRGVMYFPNGIAVVQHMRLVSLQHLQRLLLARPREGGIECRKIILC